MPSEAIITQELTFRACDEIAASGRKPTLELVRAQLATMTGTKGGSFATLGPWLKAWKEAKRTESAEPVREAVPPAVAEKVAQLANDLWGVASETANARLTSEREALSKARADSEAETAEARELADRMTEERDSALADLDETRSQLLAARADLTSTAARAEADLTNARSQAETYGLQLARLREELAAAQQRAQKAEDAADMHKELAERAGQAAERSASLLSRLEKDHAELQGQHRAAGEAAERTGVELERLRAELAAGAERERAKIDEAATAKAEAARLAEQLAELGTRHTATVAKLEDQAAAAADELRSTQKQLREASEALGKVTGEVEALRQQVAGQADVIKHFAPAKTGGSSTSGAPKPGKSSSRKT